MNIPSVLRNFLSDMKTKDSTHLAEHRRRVVLQFITSLAAVNMVVFALLYSLVDWGVLWPAGLLSLGCIPFYAGVFYLNRRGWAEGAKFLFFLILGGSIFLSTGFFVGRAPGLHSHFLLAAVLPLVLWPLKRLGTIAVVMALNLAGFLYIQMRGWEPPQIIPVFPGGSAPFFAGLSVVAVYFFILVILIFFQRRAEADAQTLQAKAKSLEDLMHKYEILAQIDPLTGLLNRRGMLERIEEERQRVLRTKEEFGILLCDLDHFKRINDNRGHEFGDTVLVAVGGYLRGGLREVDHVCRWGGEEFLILLPHTDLPGAAVVAEKLRKRVDDSGLCTLTVGVAVGSPAAKDITEVIRKADMAMYDGKNSGRNCVMVSG